MLFNIYDAFIHNILTNMLRPAFRPFSSRCYCYKNTVVVNCLTVTP